MLNKEVPMEEQGVEGKQGMWILDATLGDPTLLHFRNAKEGGRNSQFLSYRCLQLSNNPSFLPLHSVLLIPFPSPYRHIPYPSEVHRERYTEREKGIYGDGHPKAFRTMNRWSALPEESVDYYTVVAPFVPRPGVRGKFCGKGCEENIWKYPGSSTNNSKYR